MNRQRALTGFKTGMYEFFLYIYFVNSYYYQTRITINRLTVIDYRFKVNDNFNLKNT
jgi:hypothetical protein